MHVRSPCAACRDAGAASPRRRPSSACRAPRGLSTPPGLARRGPAGLERYVAVVRHAPEPAQLRQRLGVVVHADVDRGEDLRRPDHEGRRLLAPLVAARLLPGLQRGDQPSSKSRARACAGRSPASARRRRDLRACCPRRRRSGPTRSRTSRRRPGRRRPPCGPRGRWLWTCRFAAPGSAAMVKSITSCALRPSCSRRRPSIPANGLTKLCVATAPTPPQP